MKESPSVLPCVFNCSNDMALAANVEQYLPPKRIQQMEADLAELSRYWEKTVFAGPWGWSRAMRKRYVRMGVKENLLPSAEWIDEVRRLSSREYACGYIQSLMAEMADDDRLIGRDMCFCRSVEEAKERIEASGMKAAIYKLPWSSSGRGVFVSHGMNAKDAERLAGYVRTQGGFAMDRFYAGKTVDFAMEFFVGEGGTVEFLGYSVFYAAEGGAYGYNIVADQAELLSRIDVDAGLLGRLMDYHKRHLGMTAYRGPVGIDMIKVVEEGKTLVHPCIEINLRMNMGILALLLHERYGALCTRYLTPRDGRAFCAEVKDGRLMITMGGQQQ